MSHLVRFWPLVPHPENKQRTSSIPGNHSSVRTWGLPHNFCHHKTSKISIWVNRPYNALAARTAHLRIFQLQGRQLMRRRRSMLDLLKSTKACDAASGRTWSLRQNILLNLRHLSMALLLSSQHIFTKNSAKKYYCKNPLVLHKSPDCTDTGGIDPLYTFLDEPLAIPQQSPT